MTEHNASGLSRWRVLGPFAAAIAVLLVLSIGGYEMLSAVRAFVGGESLWSKARSGALAQLRLYADTGEPDAHARFVAALQVPLGDRDGREALDTTPADVQRARAGFSRGGNHADDVPGMVRLYRAFSGTPLMREAIGAWVEGDRYIEELAAIGHSLPQRLAQRPLSAAERQELHARLDELDGQLIAVEKRFSASLGAASRTAVRLLQLAGLGFALVLSVGVLVYAGRLLRSAEHSRRQLADANQRWTLATAGDGIGLFEWPLGSDSLLLDARAGALFGLQLDAGARAVRFDELRTRLQAADPQPLRDALERAGAGGALLKLRLNVSGADGRARQVEATGVMHDAAAGRPARIVGVLRDVSDEVLRAQLSADKAAAEQVARARIEFLSRLSHELRTPLNAVLGFSQLLLMDRAHALPPAAAAKVQHIESAGQHLLRLVEDVLDITRLDAAPLPMTLRPVALQPVLQAALRRVEPQRLAAQVAIVDTLPAPPVRVQADAQRLEQVLVHLLSNGCKYNRRGGTLTLSHRLEGSVLYLALRDQGEGLDADEIAQLFQPFQRLPRHAAAEGTGLGLVIVEQLLARMGGDIEVTSIKGQGSTFSMRLALAAPGDAAGGFRADA